MSSEKQNGSWLARRASRRGLVRVAGATGLPATGLGTGSNAAIAAKATASANYASGSLAGRAGAVLAQASTAGQAPNDSRIRVQHLLRRLGFAGSEAEVQHGLSIGADALLDELLNPTTIPDNLSPQLQSLDTSTAQPQDLAGWWLSRMSATSRPSLEKVTLLWHSWHTSGFDKLGAMNTDFMYNQNVYQRSNAFANFPDILKGISRQPAMEIYLDISSDVKASPNENFARELMELFSMGVGTYQENDVRESARAFTGYSIDTTARTFLFRPGQHDDGTKTFLGQSGNFSGDDIINIIMEQSATPLFVASKVWSFFAYPKPDQGTLAPIVSTFQSTSGDMRAVLKAVFTHPQFYNGPSYRALVKSPIEYIAGGSRQFGLQAPSASLASLSQQIGQEPFYPPNVAGWPGGPAWMSSGSFLARANASALLVNGTGSQCAGLDVQPYLDANKISTAGDLVDHLLLLMVDGQVASATRSMLVDYASGGHGESTPLASVSASDRTARVRGAAYLVMVEPEYQLA